jgi:integrase
VQATAATKSKARAAALASLDRELRTTGSEISARTSFAVVADEWLRQIEQLAGSGRRSAGTLGLYRHVLDKHVLPELGGLRLSEVTTARLDRFLQDKREAAGYSTAKLCRSVVSGVCGVAVRRDALRVNPVRDVSNLERRFVKQARALTTAEVAEWLGILDRSELARQRDLPDVTRFLLGTGCRLGEAVGVRWADIDLDRHLLHVRRTVIRVKGRGLVAKAPKSRSGERVLRMPYWLVVLLRERRERTEDLDVPVFPDTRGGYRDPNNVESAYRKVRAGTAYEWVVPHVYRKTVATMLDQGGLSARMIADQLGHARISMTQDVYMGRRAVDGSVASALEGLLGDSGDDPESPSLRVVS